DAASLASSPKPKARSPHEPLKQERRTSPRRAGQPVTVELAHLHSRTPHLKGWVRDRSLGGLGICVPAALAVGTKLRVQATTAPKDTAWIPIRVTSCRAEGKEFLLGCQFVEAPPVQVMFFFG